MPDLNTGKPLERGIGYIILSVPVSVRDVKDIMAFSYDRESHNECCVERAVRTTSRQ
jgi:hypothetical protein